MLFTASTEEIGTRSCNEHPLLLSVDFSPSEFTIGVLRMRLSLFHLAYNSPYEKHDNIYIANVAE